MEDIAFNDWPGQDLSGSSPWLPAYGYQPPGAILEKEDFLGSPDAALFLNGNVNAASQYVFLETIVEETSDDLRSDSSGPLAGAWLASGSESGSVIRLDLATGINDDEDELDDCDGSASECDVVCPAKRRRHDCNLLSVPSGAGGTMDDSTSLSRSSSLLQFETLEKRCQDDMYNSSPSILSSLSYEEKRPNFSPDSLNDSDSDSFQSDPECYRNEVQFRDSLFYKTKLLEAKNCDADCETSSDSSDEMIEKSKLKSDCFKFSGKTFHSFDDLNTKSTKRSNDKISAENLSEDSGYCDNMYLKHKSSSNPNFYVVNTENNSNKETKKNHQDMLRKTNNKKRHSTGFEAYDGETILSTTSACSQFGASYHDLSIFDPERISQHRIFIEKIQSGINNNPFTRGCSDHDRNLKLEPTRTSEFVSAPKNNFVESNSEPNLTVYRLEESEDCHNFTDCFTKDIRFATKEFSKSLDRFTFDNSEVTCGGVSSVPRDLNLAGDCWAFVNPSSPSIAAKNWDLGDLSKQELNFTDNFTSVFVNNDINSSDEEKMATKRILKNETIKNSKLNNDISTCILGNAQKNKTLNNYDYSTLESSSFKTADGYTNLLDDSPEDHCYNIDIQTDILEFEENLEKAISNSSIPSFKDKDEFLFHSTPINKRTVLSTPNLTTFESEIDFIKNITDNVAIRNTAPLKNDPSLSKGLSGSEGRNIGGILQTGMSANKSSIAGSGSTSKGVHFCEVVSEVCWREASYSDEASSAYSESDIVSGSDNDDDGIYAHKMRNKNNTYDDNDNNSETDSENNYCFNNETVKSRDIKEVNEQYDNNINITEKKNVKTLNEAYVKNGELEDDRDGVDCKHLDTNTTTVTPTMNAGTASHVVAGTGEHPAVNNQLSRPADSVTVMESKSEVLPTLAQPQQMKRPKSANKLGGFLSRFTNFRFSTRASKHDRKKQTISAPICTTEINNTNSNAVKINSVNNETKQTDYIYIPLKGPVEKDNQVNETEYVTDKTFSKILIDGKPVELGGKVDSKVNSKPPLPKQPPRVVGASVKRQNNAQACVSGPRSIDSCSGGSRLRYAGSSASSADNRHVLSPMEIPPGLIETDLDTHITVVSSSGPNGKKTRSLMNLDSGLVEIRPGEPGRRIHQVSGDVGALQSDTVRPHKSMEFLLDKQNLKVVEPPENELQKGTGERIMSEHQLRVQRSLQKLNVPEWFKQSQVPREGFLLKKRETTKWQGFSGKTTSLSSLGGSRQSPVLLSPSPQSTTAGFSRWSTSKLNSTASSPCNSTRSSFNYRQPFTGLLANGTTSPCGSTRSSFSYRQPYLGWRSQSQERLTKPRTPAERLATSILPPTSTTASTPNSEIQTSIKEVTSAIVHYVSGLKPDSTTHVDTLGIIKHESRGSSPRLERDSISASPRLRDYEYQETASQRSRSISPSSRGSQKLCWLESSFVGTRPLDSPQTPIGLAADVSETIKSPNYTGLHLDLKTKNQGTYDQFSCTSGLTTTITRPSPGSTTLEDVLDSLLGLPPATRAPSPSLQETASVNSSPGHWLNANSNRERFLNANVAYRVSDRRRSEGNEGTKETIDFARRVSFHITPDSPSLKEITTVHCKYTKCNNTATFEDAKKYFKNCHNCNYVYCSRECRRLHWEKHRKTCLHSRASSLCRQILAKAKDDTETLQHISLLARRGFISHGPGVVKCFFNSPEAAERFISGGLPHLSEPTYIRWPDLLPSEMGPELFSEIVKICKSYNPETRLVLYVAVCVVSEVPTSGAIKWERQLVSRCAKLRLSKSAQSDAATQILIQHRPKSPCNIIREMDNPETLILTSLPGSKNQMSVKRSREISFTNIQRQLKQRGVSLKKHFPEVYQKLCEYVEGASDRFTPVTVYPKDGVSGKNFMCIIMPDAEPDKLDLFPADSVRVKTVDVGKDQE